MQSLLSFLAGVVVVLGLAWIIWWYLRRRKKLASKPAPTPRK